MAQIPNPEEKSESTQPAVVLPPVAAKAPRTLTVKDDGSVALLSLEDQLVFAERLIRERLVSSTFQTPQQVVIGFQYAKALQLNELLALKMMYVVNGKPCLYGEGPLALCQRSGQVANIDEFFVDENGDRIGVDSKNLKARPYAAVTRLWRKGDDLRQEDFFTLDDLAQAGLNIDKFGKTKDVWAKFERIMMRYKARSMGLKVKFADLIAGIPIAEYDHHFSPDMPDIVVSKNTAADELNKVYGTAPPSLL